MSKIAINGYFLTRPYSGIGTYTKNLLAGLGELDRESNYNILVPEKLSLDLPANFKLIPLPYCRFGGPGFKKLFWEQIQIPNYCRQAGINFLHTPYPANPYSGHFRRLKFKTCVTVHDVIPWIDPRYTKKLRSRFIQFISRKTLKTANSLICVSNETKKQLLKLFNDLNIIKKTVVIHNFLKPELKNFNPSGEKKNEKANFKNFPAPSRPYFLYVGGYDPRKNVPRLISAFLEANARHKFQLILAGKSYINDVAPHETEASLATKSGKNGDFIYTGFISDHELAKLYKNCFAFLNFSQAEGFNLPLLEAAAAAKPIATSDLPVHREVLGDAAIFSDPHSTSSTTEAIIQLMKLSENERAQLGQKALAESRKFRWRIEIHKVMGLYNKILGNL